MKETAKLVFEDAMLRLEKIVAEMESNNLSIEESIARFEEASKLMQFCEKKLGNFEKKVEVLTSSNNQGEWKNLNS